MPRADRQRRLEPQPSAYTIALQQLREFQNWLSREMIKASPDWQRIAAVRELRDQAERRVRWIERAGRR